MKLKRSMPIIPSMTGRTTLAVQDPPPHGQHMSLFYEFRILGVAHQIFPVSLHFHAEAMVHTYSSVFLRVIADEVRRRDISDVSFHLRCAQQKIVEGSNRDEKWYNVRPATATRHNDFQQRNAWMLSALLIEDVTEEAYFACITIREAASLRCQGKSNIWLGTTPLLGSLHESSR
jgi:hypothetical protein